MVFIHYALTIQMTTIVFVHQKKMAILDTYLVHLYSSLSIFYIKVCAVIKISTNYSKDLMSDTITYICNCTNVLSDFFVEKFASVLSSLPIYDLGPILEPITHPTPQVLVANILSVFALILTVYLKDSDWSSKRLLVGVPMGDGRNIAIDIHDHEGHFIEYLDEIAIALTVFRYTGVESFYYNGKHYRGVAYIYARPSAPIAPESHRALILYFNRATWNSFMSIRPVFTLGLSSNSDPNRADIRLSDFIEKPLEEHVPRSDELSVAVLISPDHHTLIRQRRQG